MRYSVTATLPARSLANSPGPLQSQVALSEIERLDEQLTQKFAAKLTLQPSLTRALVSFQANKNRALYRCYKYKEGFSAALVEHLLHRFDVAKGRLLDPFAGSGTALFAAQSLGWDADGIELLPIGQKIVAARQLLTKGYGLTEKNALQEWATQKPWQALTIIEELPELRITRGAYPSDTKQQIVNFWHATANQPEFLREILRFALLCVLETVSYTRKDGQYLRWDDRAGRRVGKKPFDKGHIPNFDVAITAKINEIISDLEPDAPQAELFPQPVQTGQVQLYGGSCLAVLPDLPTAQYDAVFTSPPYCNRYDYTRTYALELALLGLDDRALIDLRQEMLSCTVENKAKELLHLQPSWIDAINAAENQPLLQTILSYLEQQKAAGLLNNSGIPRMVRGYFYELACVIAECARVLKPNAPLFMVNDNVRYAGASVSVDLILSEIAEKLGFRIAQIMVLPNGKGNSSQQMGLHGRESLRKCVYVWRRM